MSVCDNCGATQGPFNHTSLFWKTYLVCKNTKSEQDRVTKCVAKRDKIDLDRYKELMAAYA